MGCQELILGNFVGKGRHLQLEIKVRTSNVCCQMNYWQAWQGSNLHSSVHIIRVHVAAKEE